MAGFPTRPIRDSFGPTLENEAPVTNPKREIGQNTFNLAWWQVAGMSQVCPRAVIKAEVSGGVVTTQYQGLSFDPHSSVPDIAFVYISAGRYSFAFDSQYPDEQGTMINLSLIGGAVFPQGTTARMGMVALSSGHEGEVCVFDSAGAAADADGFILVLY